MDKLNIKITEDKLAERHGNLDLLRPLYRRTHEALHMFRPWIKPPIIDLGCREGVLLSFLDEGSHACGQMYGVDLSDIAIEYLKANLLDEKITGIVGDLEQLPIASEKFNTVFAIHVIEHCKHMRKAIKEVHRILKPGGHALIEVPLQKKEPVPTKFGHWYCFSTEQDILNKFNFLFKKIHIFRKEGKPWRRIVFQKEE